MKPIKGLDSATPGLASYLSSGPRNCLWPTFQQEDAAAYRELRDRLVERQRGLCGYCEQRLVEGDCQVEHIVPRSLDKKGHAFDLDYSNMLASCKGGSANDYFGPKTVQHDAARVGDESCGQAKGDINDNLFIDPRSLPQERLLFKIKFDGSIEPDEEACHQTGIDRGRVDRTIDILGLDVDRLKRERAKFWEDISSVYENHLGNKEAMLQAARAALLPNENGILEKYFTTTRSFFAPICDSFLAESPDTWI